MAVARARCCAPCCCAGPQTPGELRGRSERMHRLEDLDEVQLVLQKLIEHDPPLVRLLPRQPGTKEARYAELFGADTRTGRVERARQPGGQSADDAAGREERIARWKPKWPRLRAEVEALREEFADFRSQFES